MADYVIVNGGATELTDVNAGGSDVAAGAVSADITLDATELAAVASADSVAVMQASATATEKLNAMVALLADADPGDALTAVLTVLDAGDVADGAGSAVDAFVGNPSDGTRASSSLTPTALAAALAAGKVVIADDVTDEAKRKAAKTLTHGTLPGVKTS